jgi:uncharacterized protein (TIGR02391 family)
MLLTDTEMKLVRQAVEVQSGMDQELVERCSPLVHIAAFDEAVSKAFVIVEERMRRLLKKENLTGMQMVQFGFSPEGPLTKLLADRQQEREGFQALLTGAFKLYRNPTAHTIVGYEGAEARAIISLLDLILRQIKRFSDIPQLEKLPATIEQLMQYLEAKTDAKVANRVRLFASKCIREGFLIRATATQWIPFRKHALIQRENTAQPKAHAVVLFYITGTEKEQGLWFPVNQYYSPIVGLNLNPIKKALKELGFQPWGDKTQDYYASLLVHNSQEFLDQVFQLIRKVAADFEATLNQS